MTAERNEARIGRFHQGRRAECTAPEAEYKTAICLPVAPKSILAFREASIQDPMILNEIPYSSLGVEERRGPQGRSGRNRERAFPEARHLRRWCVFWSSGKFQPSRVRSNAQIRTPPHTPARGR